MGYSRTFPSNKEGVHARAASLPKLRGRMIKLVAWREGDSTPGGFPLAWVSFEHGLVQAAAC